MSQQSSTRPMSEVTNQWVHPAQPEANADWWAFGALEYTNAKAEVLQGIVVLALDPASGAALVRFVESDVPVHPDPRMDGVLGEPGSEWKPHINRAAKLAEAMVAGTEVGIMYQGTKDPEPYLRRIRPQVPNRQGTGVVALDLGKEEGKNQRMYLLERISAVLPAEAPDPMVDDQGRRWVVLHTDSLNGVAVEYIAATVDADVFGLVGHWVRDEAEAEWCLAGWGVTDGSGDGFGHEDRIPDAPPWPGAQDLG